MRVSNVRVSFTIFEKKYDINACVDFFILSEFRECQRWVRTPADIEGSFSGVERARKVTEWAELAEGVMRKLFPCWPVWDPVKKEVVWDPGVDIEPGL